MDVKPLPAGRQGTNPVGSAIPVRSPHQNGKLRIPNDSITTIYLSTKPAEDQDIFDLYIKDETDAIGQVAVGTPITRRPPRRSVRAALPHTALTLENAAKELTAHRTTYGTRKLPHCVGKRVRLNDVLLGPRPSLPNLR